MGVVSYCIRCVGCDAKYRLRYNVGNKYPQSATFPCEGCGEDLTIGVDENERDYLTRNIERIEEDRTLKVINLHPEITIDPEFINDPLYFPSINSLVKQGDNGPTGIYDFKRAQLTCVAYQESWDQVKVPFRYLKEKRWGLLEKDFGTNTVETELKVLSWLIFTLDFFLDGVWRKMFPGLKEELTKTMQHEAFPEFKAYLLERKEDVFYNKMFNVMTAYREIEAVLLPTLLDQKCGFVPSGISSKNDWNKIKSFYGQVYEIFGDMLVVPSAMNNLFERGDFRKFATDGFTWEKYEDSDKAGRTVNFVGNLNLAPLADFYKAAIRNGTHHEAATFDKNTQIITLHTGKGGRTLKTMSLIDYIMHCNELYARLLIAFRMYNTLVHG